jgi:hypothetical protein
VMPDHSRSRRETPPEANRTLTTLLNRHFGENGPEVLWLNASMPDDRFTDIVHLDSEGRRMFSKKLAEALNASRSADPARRTPAAGRARPFRSVVPGRTDPPDGPAWEAPDPSGFAAGR